MVWRGRRGRGVSARGREGSLFWKSPEYNFWSCSRLKTILGLALFVVIEASVVPPITRWRSFSAGCGRIANIHQRQGRAENESIRCGDHDATRRIRHQRTSLMLFFDNGAFLILSVDGSLDSFTVTEEALAARRGIIALPWILLRFDSSLCRHSFVARKNAIPKLPVSHLR